MERFWECYVEGTDGGKHYNWYTKAEAEAESEAERLAKLPDVQDRTVYLFECIGKCRIEQVPVRWEIPR